VHPRFFTDWVQDVVDPTDNDAIPVRWRVVTSLQKNLDKSRALDLVRLAATPALSHQAVHAQIVHALRKQYSAYPEEGRELEVRRLAGSVAASYFMEHQDQLADTIALAIICSNFLSTADSTGAPPFLNDALAYRRKRIASTHPSELKGGPMSAIQESQLKGNPTADGQPATFSTAVIAKKLAALSRDTKVSIEEMRTFSRVISEEANMAWWLLGEFSRDLEQPLSSLPSASVPLIVGNELADLCLTPFGPRAARAVLWQGLKRSGISPDTPIDPASCAEALPQEVADRVAGLWSSGLKPDGLTPLSAAIVARATAQSNSITQPHAAPVLFETMTQIKYDRLNKPRSAVEIAEAFFHEKLFVTLTLES
jgi:hypothetical protein